MAMTDVPGLLSWVEGLSVQAECVLSNFSVLGQVEMSGFVASCRQIEDSENERNR